MKAFIRSIHLYLSFATGLVVMAVCFSGAVLVFEEELQHGLHRQRYYVQPQAQAMSPEALVAAASNQLPGAKVHGIKWYAQPNRSVEIAYSVKAAGSKPAKGEGGDNRRTAFVNPYTGQLLETYSYRETFFYTMMSLHRWLLGGSTGKLIVGICTLLFLVILITGLILWWPKTRAMLQQRIRIKWNAQFKRLNHDLHVVFGFYSLIFLFVFGFTGLAWSFEWFNKAIYTVTNSSMERPKPPASVLAGNTTTVGPNRALQQAMQQWPTAQYYNLSLPKDSSDVYTVSALQAHAPHTSASDQLYIDQYSGQVLRTNLYADRNLGQRVRSTFKPVHTGAILGWPGKIIAVITCLFGVSFPITGTIMWWNRTRKSKAA